MARTSEEGKTGKRGPLLPSDAELDQIVLGPDSLVWRRFGDARLYLGAGYALLLQVSHPTVSAGVRDHSTFAADPWGRLVRTMDYLNLLVYGGREAAIMGRRLRALHQPIRGTNPNGGRYHALEPEAYAWVHATLVESALATLERFVGRLSAAEADRFCAEYVPLGRLVGVREGDLPLTRAGMREYVRVMVAERLERTETVELLLEVLDRPAPPGLPVVDRLWPLLRVPPARALRTATIGLLGEPLRERFGVRWGRGQELELRALAGASRALTPVLPPQLRNLGPAYLRRRRRAIAEGPLGRAHSASTPRA